MALVTPRPLETAWESLLATCAPRTIDARSLAIVVDRLSRRYQGESVSLARTDERVARIQFWFPRDLQKLALPIAELGRAGALPDRELHVLDVGAGVGASSAGLLRVIADATLLGGTARKVSRLVAVDRDADVLPILRDVLQRASDAGLIARPDRLDTAAGSIESPEAFASPSHPYDLIVVANALVEATAQHADEATRGAAMASRIESLIGRAPLAHDGALIVVEPATREQTRSLHHARAQLIARGFGIFAPCTHEDTCPMLARERDWCHEDLPVDLPPWLHDVAREAGLRWEGLTFSYLVVRRDHRHSVRSLLPVRDATPAVPARIISTPRATKGKTEAFASGAFPGSTLARLMQLDRDVRNVAGVQLRDLSRGDVVAIRPGARVDPERPIRIAPSSLVTPDGAEPAAGNDPTTGADRTR